MARRPNYDFERRERDRLKALKTTEKADAKREQRARQRAAAEGDEPPAEDGPTD
jgi:hypothetical protein